MKTKLLLHSIYTLLISACALSMTGCGDKNEPTPPTPPEPAGPAERTVLVYMAANNNLGSSRYDRMDIDEMRQAAKAGDSRGGRLVIYHAGYNTAPTLVEILADRLDTLKVYDNENLSVSSARMAEVFSDLDEKVPARQYGLVLWSHGTGWLQDGMEEPERRRSFGLEGRHTMNVSTLAQTIEEAPFKLDFVYFDCCYMMSVETLYQMRHTAPVIAGSTTELLTTGMPYDQNIACFFTNGQADLIGAAQNTFNLYNAMSGQNRTCTMSVLSTDGLARLADAVREIYLKATPGMPEGYTPQIFSNASVSSCHYFDLYDYIKTICRDFDGADKLWQEFEAAFNAAMLYSEATPKLWNVVPLDRCHGLSTYILTSDRSASLKNYNTLDWYTDVASVIKFKE